MSTGQHMLHRTFFRTFLGSSLEVSGVLSLLMLVLGAVISRLVFYNAWFHLEKKTCYVQPASLPLASSFALASTLGADDPSVASCPACSTMRSISSSACIFRGVSL